MADLGFIQELQMEQTTHYLTTVAGALVAYDHVLTFSQEVDLVWNRQWSFVTALYLTARYSGDLLLIGLAASFMCANWTYSGYVNMYLTMAWASNIFLLTMQAILVVRVYALFNWSKKVLTFLATSYVLQAIITFVLTGLDANKQVYDEYITSVGPAIGNVQLVSVNPSAHPHVINFIILSIVFDTVLLLFALWAFVKHALQAKTPEGGWSINVLVKTLVADYLLYFVCNLLWLSLSLVTAYSTTESDVFHILHYYVLVVFNTLVVVAGPRMVISLRSIENKTRGEGGTLAGELSTLQFVIRELPTQLESVMEEGNGFRAMDGHAPID